ncbi:trypsin-like peptidase domain-containing protein [Bradyrhizobium manausense]|uniref:trypsin-like peptidase domain-containing protein n=1 Tax=Bradyrhizobium manausense TaxID=989370 RepID=UPI00201169BB|nr:trypsin-like peptidase domain-containing protein [Bradyrhizobium manausense]
MAASVIASADERKGTKRYIDRGRESASHPIRVTSWMALLLLATVKVATAQTTDETLLAYAVNIHQTPMQTWGPGYGIYLGHGYFLTAAHVAGRTWFTRPKVTISGQEFPTRVIKEGQLEATDLTLLAVEENLLPMRLRLRRMRLCDTPPRPGQEVVTVVPEAVVRSRIITPERIPAAVRRFNTAIVDVAKTGNSGSGVFDVKQRCLLGIMSRKISQKRTNLVTRKEETYDIAKYFVPAAEIAAFVPAGTFDAR